MKNLDLLFTSNKSPNMKYYKKIVKLKKRNKKDYWLYKKSGIIFTGEHIYELINVVNYLLENDNKNTPICIRLESITFADKLVYIILECICYYLLEKRDLMVDINFENRISSDGIKHSPLIRCNNKILVFKNKFFKDDGNKHYRRLIEYNTIKEDYLTEIGSEIYFFFKHILNINDDINHKLSETITELIGNSIEHGNSDCLVDIDVTDDKYYKKNICNTESHDDSFFGINVVVLNFSKTLLYDELKKRLDNFDCISDRYNMVIKAKEHHHANLHKNYKFNDFYVVAAFQNRISGKSEKGISGGRGLYTLIKSMDEKSDNHNCYVLSAKRILSFKKEFLQCDENDFIGFNSQHNFLSCIPDVNSFDDCHTYFPGTAYNLSFAVKKGAIKND